MKQLAYVWRWFADPAREKGKVVRPRMLNFPVTDTCNARCVMCDVWKENATDDMTVEQLRTVLEQPFFQDLEHVGISGGEPFLRTDLTEVVEAFCRLPKLKTVSITSHGFNLARHRSMGPRLVSLLRARGVGFTMNLSIDGVGVFHDRVRRVPGGFEKLEQTIDFYRSMDVTIVGQCTVSKTNLYNLAELDAFTRERGIAMIYRLATVIERLSNGGTMNGAALDERERSFFADFLSYSGVVERTRNPARRLFYRQLVQTLRSGTPRAAPCYFMNEAVLLSSRGEAFQCSVVKNPFGDVLAGDVSEHYFSAVNLAALQEGRSETCARCPHDQTGAWDPLKLAVEEIRNSKIGKSLEGGTRVLLKAFNVAVNALRRLPAAVPIAERAQFAHVVVIGCYGGEHVGDAAILGGVLLRLRERFGIRRATVLSSRTDRTRGWVDNLDLPIEIDVKPYTRSSAAGVLEGADLLAIGGGPVMDLPSLLAKHIDTAAMAIARGIPLVVEGVGFGPFRRDFSRRQARRLLAMASDASIRTRRSFTAASSVFPRATRTIDPAFTYLQGLDVTALPVPAFIADLSARQKPLVAINLRPLWSRYATADVDEAAVRNIEQRCLEVVSEVINAHPDYNFVFIPFNSDQLGMSDLNIALRLQSNRLMHGNFFVWQAEPSIAEAVAALHACTALIAMRFHACIFGLASGRPVFGIDYAIGKTSKVGELLEENDAHGTWQRVDQLDSAALGAFLQQHVGAGEGQTAAPSSPHRQPAGLF